jgi:hypothetical protein
MFTCRLDYVYMGLDETYEVLFPGNRNVWRRPNWGGCVFM